jgi:ABC-type Fe3+/spermidine/putrescine transport system ATPase subunit
MVKLDQLKDRSTSQLSGGQQQRVALARALAFEPPVVLFDEPLSNLDAKLRDEMRLELLQLQRDLGFSALYVTHDQQEATGLSARVVIMRDGHIEQEGSPQEIWARPASAFVAEFLGQANRLDGVLKGAADSRGHRLLQTDFGPSLSVAAPDEMPDGARVAAYVNYGRIALERAHPDAPDRADDGWWRGQIRLVSFRGYAFLMRIGFGTGDLVVRADDAQGLREGDDVYVRVSPEHVYCFAAE